MGFLSKGAFFCCVLALPVISLLFAAPSLVEAQRCQVFEFTLNYPPNVNPGESVQVNTTLGIACAQWRTWYMARLDLVDRTSESVLSSSIFDIGWRPVVNGTVSNSATAPQTVGSWGLVLMLYLFERGGFIGSMNQPFDIQVGAPAVTMQQTTSSSAISISTPSLTTTRESSMAVPSIEGTSAASPLTLSPNYLVPASLIGVIIVLAAVLVKVRKRNA